VVKSSYRLIPLISSGMAGASWLSESARRSMGEGIERPDGNRELRRSLEVERDLSKVGEGRVEVITLIEGVGSA
jgi:hypothetical protein